LHLVHNDEDLNELKNLPLDSRTLLYCPKSGRLSIIPMENCQYFHLGLKEGLTHLLQQYPYMQQLNVLPVWIAIDGIPILGHEFWSIIEGLKLDTEKILPFLIGVYCGDKKPGNVMEYLKQLIVDINHILDDGFELNNHIYNIKIMGFIADAPARYELCLIIITLTYTHHKLKKLSGLSVHIAVAYLSHGHWALKVCSSWGTESLSLNQTK